MIKPSSIATDGYLCQSTLSIAVNGYICVEKEVPVISVVDGGDGKGSRRKTVQYYDKYKHRKRLIQEEDEIVAIIKIFLQCQNLKN